MPSISEVVRAALKPVIAVDDCQHVVELVGDGEFALLGEASHGTHEFYAMRAEITKRLILESGFRAIAIEGDWPDTYRVNEYVHHVGNDPTAVQALADFGRFP